MSKLYLGVDGGQSSTTALIGDETGRVLGAGRGGPCNHVHFGEGAAKLTRAVNECVAKACEQAHLDPKQIHFQAACFGMSGGPEDKEALLSQILSTEKLIVTHDGLIALSGATAGEPGIITIAGTGSFSFGRNAAGQTMRAGGWGYIFGDEGSGFAIGCAAVRAALHARDGTGDPTILVDRLSEIAGMPLAEIPMAFYEGRIDRSRIAAFSPAVSRGADERDPVAVRIVNEAAAALARLVAAVISQLRWPDGPVAVGPVGGVFDAGRTILRPLGEALARTATAAVLVPPRLAPAAGAVLLAMRAAGVPLTPPLLALLAATWELRRVGASAGA